MPAETTVSPSTTRTSEGGEVQFFGGAKGDETGTEDSEGGEESFDLEAMKGQIAVAAMMTRRSQNPTKTLPCRFGEEVAGGGRGG